MILGIACLAGCVGTTIPVQAQQTATAIVVKERLVEHVGDRLIIDMKLALDELSHYFGPTQAAINLIYQF